MTEPRALVGNAADPEQVEEAGRKEKRGRAQELDDWAVTFDTPQRRRTLKRLLAFCGVKHTVFGPTDAWTNFNAGKQDVGHFVEAQVREANTEIFYQMELEDKKEKQV